nr:uncharacterized protein LOC111111337 isoform X2 [Crassostrea virginica]
MAVGFLLAVLLFQSIESVSAQTGENVCTRTVSTKVSYIQTTTVSVKKCSSPNVCQTVYALKKILKFRIQYSTQIYCCPGFVLEDNTCVAITTTPPTTIAPPTTTQDVVGPNEPLEGALTEGAGSGALPEGAVVGVVLAVLGVIVAGMVAVIVRIRKNKSSDRQGIVQQEIYRGQSVHGTNEDLDRTAGAFHNDLYNLENKPPADESSSPEMYDQLHLYGNEADEESHDYERPARSHTIGGPPRALHKKPSQENPSVKSDGHLPAMYQNKTAVTNRVKVFERLASRQNDDTASDNQMFYSDVRY